MSAVVEMWKYIAIIKWIRNNFVVRGMKECKTRLVQNENQMIILAVNLCIVN